MIKIRAHLFISAERGSFSLIGMLIALVIMLVLTLLILGGPQIFSRNKSGAGGGVMGAVGGTAGGAVAARNEALEVTCKNNLQQLRAAIQMFAANGEGNPQSLDDLARANPGLQLNCPVGHEPYQYDPAAGQVRCVHPGHERF